MAGSVNKVTLLGNVGKDPDIRATQGGDQIASFSLATTESWTDKASGDKREKTEWHRIVVFNAGIAGVVEKYVRKGSKVYVEGALQTRSWTDQAGTERYITEIVLGRFNGQLVLLGDPRGDGEGGARREEAAGAGERRRETSGGRSGYRAPPSSMSDRAAAQGGTGGGWEPGSGGKDLDDEIPFAACWQ